MAKIVPIDPELLMEARAWWDTLNIGRHGMVLRSGDDNILIPKMDVSDFDLVRMFTHVKNQALQVPDNQ